MSLSDVQPAPGVLLVAPPMMQDPNFRRAVVLLCEHGPDGSFGLVLNRPLSLHLSDVLEEPGAYEAPLQMGGPVQPNTLHFLHRFGALVPDAVSLGDGLFWGGDFEHVQALADADDVTPHQLRFYLGYAGWSPGQLDDEIEDDGWILTPAVPPLIFDVAPDDLWRVTMRHMGGEFALLAHFPDDPRMN